MTRPVDPKTARAAEAFAKKQLKSKTVKIRPATRREALGVHAKRLDSERAVDVVVATGRKGKQVLLTVEDQAATKRLNRESAIATGIGMIPVAGPFMAAAIALKDIAQSTIDISKALHEGHSSSPGTRAMLRMGLKHLGVAVLSIASEGAAHHVMAAVEMTAASKDLVDSKPLEHWKQLPRSMLNAVTGLFSVHGHTHAEEGNPDEDLRVVMVRSLGREAPAPVPRANGPPKAR